VCRAFTWEEDRVTTAERPSGRNRLRTPDGGSDPVVHDVGVRRDLHQRDGAQDVVDVVAEVQHRVGDDGLGGGDGGRQQRQRGGQRQGGLQLLHRRLLEEEEEEEREGGGGGERGRRRRRGEGEERGE